jgi:hypothetical protein
MIDAMNGMVGSLRGKSVKPAEGSCFSGVIAIPKGFRKEGETGNDVAYRYLTFLDDQDTLTSLDTFGPPGTICD